MTEQLIQQRISRKRDILINKDDLILEPLTRMLACSSRKAVTLWALELAGELSEIYTAAYGFDENISRCADICRAWAEGRVRMSEARPCILGVHAIAGQTDNRARTALCHAIAQCCSVVHTVKHAPGGPIYDLTYIIRVRGPEGIVPELIERTEHYVRRLKYWQTESRKGEYARASFIR